jgi:hypothetical protein
MSHSLKYDEDFLRFCYKSLQKDFKDPSSISLKSFLSNYLNDLSMTQENSLLFPLKGLSFFYLLIILLIIEEHIEGNNQNPEAGLFNFFLENYHFRYINELKYLKLHEQSHVMGPQANSKSRCLIDNEGNFSTLSLYDHLFLFFFIIFNNIYVFSLIFLKNP